MTLSDWAKFSTIRSIARRLRDSWACSLCDWAHKRNNLLRSRIRMSQRRFLKGTFSLCMRKKLAEPMYLSTLKFISWLYQWDPLLYCASGFCAMLLRSTCHLLQNLVQLNAWRTVKFGHCVQSVWFRQHRCQIPLVTRHVNDVRTCNSARFCFIQWRMMLPALK